MAAGARRSLTSGFTLISRRFHPSLSHLLPNPHDRDQSKSQSPSSNPQSLCRSPNLTGSRDLGFALPLGLDPFLRSYSSSSSATGGSSEIGFIKDIADVLTDPAIDTSSSAVAAAPSPFPGEVAAAAADSFPPVAALQHLIDIVHSISGTNWWVSLVLTTILIRGVTVPLLLNQMRSTIKLSAMRPEMEALKEEMQNSMDPQTMMENQKRMKALFKKHGVTPFTPLKGLLIQGPVFISFFMAISNMVEKVPSMKGGGAFWFTDLTTPDPFYALPILTGLIFLATVELNMQEGMEGNPMAALSFTSWSSGPSLDHWLFAFRCETFLCMHLFFFFLSIPRWLKLTLLWGDKPTLMSLVHGDYFRERPNSFYLSGRSLTFFGWWRVGLCM